MIRKILSNPFPKIRSKINNLNDYELSKYYEKYVLTVGVVSGLGGASYGTYYSKSMPEAIVKSTFGFVTGLVVGIPTTFILTPIFLPGAIFTSPIWGPGYLYLKHRRKGEKDRKDI